jgi:hypothetical protein
LQSFFSKFFKTLRVELLILPFRAEKHPGRPELDMSESFW